MSNYFELFVTCVDKIGPMLKIWGQADRVSSMFIEQLLKNTSAQFDREAYVPQLAHLTVGLLCCAKYKDGHYYRAQIINLRNLISGSIEVKFIDYGNAESITIENIRLLQNVPAGLTTMKAQAVDFILANVIHVNRNWDEKALAFIHQEIAYMELKSVIIGAVNHFRFLKVVFHDSDLSDYLIQKGIATHIPLPMQEMILRGPPLSMPFSNPIAIRGNPLSPSGGLQSPGMIPMQELCSYKTLPLQTNSEHMVYVSYVEDGPYLFSIQLQSLEEVLEKLMIEINQLPLLPLTEPPIPGYPCMARCLEDNSLCRAVVINLVEDKCKTYYVDFGNTDILPFSNIFQIPFKYILPKVMSMRFTLAGLKSTNVTNEMKCTFKEFVTNKLLKLKVLKLEGSPVMQYCELYEGDLNITNILYESANEYKTIQISKGLKYNIVVSYIEGCKKFFVQLKEFSESLNNLMLTLNTDITPGTSLQSLDIGTPVLAFYAGDGQWYRAQITSLTDTTATVKYVDYGNYDTVTFNYLKKIDQTLVKIIPAQAVECCLYGYQNMSFNTEIENVFESLTLECEFSMKVISKQANDALLIDLFDTCGNNVAALLIEKLAAQKSQVSPLPAHQISQSLLNKLAQSPVSEKSYEKSPSRERSSLSWRNSTNDKPVEKQPDYGNEKKNWRDKDEKKSWRSTEDSPTADRNTDNWNGDSPTNKRSYAKNDRTTNMRNNNSPSKENKFRSDKFSNDKSNNDKFNNDTKRAPPSKRDKISGSDSEKSWSEKSTGNRSGKNFEAKREYNNKPARKDFAKPEEKFQKRKVELPPQDMASFETKFQYLEINPNQVENITVSWFYNPESFYCQLLSHQKEFRDQMSEIQTAYVGRSALGTPIPIGASIIAEFHEDGILYRATVLEDKHPKYKVQYVDFGNMSLVDCSKIWQVETKFISLPIQAVKCGLSGLKPAAETWTVSTAIDNIFNKENFNCVFDGFIEDKYTVQLSEDNVDVKQQLIESGVAVDVNVTSFEMTDEPIDLNILIGQNIRVNLSFIYGLSKFYVQPEKDKANQVQAFVDSFMSTTSITDLQKFPEDQIEIDATCLTKTETEKWYRGVIADKSELTNLKIDHPDFGSSEQKSFNEIYVLPTQLCAFWYQAFECSLHNLTEEVTKLVNDEEFKQTYEGKELIMYVDEIINGRLIVTLYDLSGIKLNLIDPDEGSYPTIDPICPQPILQSNPQVWITHIESPSSIYVQLNSHSNKIASTLESLFECYETTTTPAKIAIGELCCAKSENDGNWYRGRVETIENDIITVFYLDYGNTEIVPKPNLRNLGVEFYGHELSLHVSLNLQQVGDRFVDKFTELTTAKLVEVKLSYGDSGWIGEFFDGDLNLNQALIECQVAQPLQEVIDQELVEEDSRAQIIITHIDSPSEFYVQLLTNNDQIYSLQSDLQERVLQLPDVDGADVGVLCAARYSLDEQWYRAEVLDADSDITTVRFVDYGNTDVINNKSGAIKILPSDLLAIDKYARKCALNVSPVGKEWAREACDIFEKAIDVQDISADIVYQDEKSKTYVELFVNGVNISLQLLEQNLACAITRDAEDSLANHTGFVSHCNSISEFWIQLESSVLGLEMIVDRLAVADTFPDLQDLSPGTLCAANFPDDEMWYRARILSNTVAGIEVLFVDYGNSSTALKLKTLPEDLIQIPFLAQKCSLNKPANLEWSDSAINTFKEISADGVTIFTIKKLTAGETSVVELAIDGQNIVEQLKDLCDIERATPIGGANLVKVYVTHIESPSYFWVQLSTDAEQIDEINETLAGANDFEPLTNWDSVTTCAALYEETSIWYRANILQFDESYEVLLIDYGKILRTNDLRKLPEHLQTISPLATLCALELPNETTEWSESASDRFNTILNDSECRAEFVDKEMPNTVRLFIGKRNIGEEILADTPVETAKIAKLTTESLCILAENTKLPEGAIDTDDELLDVPETSIYKACDVTVKDTTLDFETSFASCADVTSTNLETEKTDIVESTDKADDILPKVEDSISRQDSQDTEIENEATPVLDSQAGDESNFEAADNNLKIQDISPEMRDTTSELQGLASDILDTTAEIHETTSEIQNISLNIQEILPEDATTEIHVSSVKNQDTIPEVLDTVSETSQIVDTSLKTSASPIEMEQTQSKRQTVISPEMNSEKEDTISESDDSPTEIYEQIYELQDLLLTKMGKIETARQATLLGVVDKPMDKLESKVEGTLSDTKYILSEIQDTSSNIPNAPLKVQDEPSEIKDISEPSSEGFEASDASEMKDAHCEITSILEFQIAQSENLDKSLTDDSVLDDISTIAELNTSRPATPHCDKIVPGSISRGDLEKPSSADLEKTFSDDLEVAETFAQESEPLMVQISRKLSIPHSEKIVPGSICRGNTETPPPLERCPITPHSEKIVPGSVCRGDLTNSTPIKREVEAVVRPMTPKIPLDEKLLPGCFGPEDHT